MRLPSRSICHRCAIFALALLFLAPAALFAPAARAGEHGGAPPAAIRFSITLKGSVGSTSISGQAEGVLDDNGDIEANLSLTSPASHSLSIIGVGGTGYVSVDGSPYEVESLADLTGDQSTPAVSEACAEAGRMQSLSTETPRDLLERAGFDPTGGELVAIDGVETRHVSGMVDLEALFSDPALLRGLGAIASACGEAIPAIEPQDIQLLAAGSKISVDAYLEQPGDFPRRFALSLDVPLISLSVELKGDLTPLQAPVAISPPLP